MHCAFAVSGSKKKKLGSTAVVNRRIYRLEIHCKVISVYMFSIQLQAFVCLFAIEAIVAFTSVSW